MPDDAQATVFISYGRRDAAPFVARLAEDLSRANFKVWVDTVDLPYPHPWDEQIEAAIKASNVVIAVLTPHAVRSSRQGAAEGEDSVCLDELAFARFHRPPTPIVPIMLLPCEPPFIIMRLNYLDFIRADAEEARYRAALERLLAVLRDVLRGNGPSYRAARFEPLDFDLYLNAKLRDFISREWLVSEVLGALHASDAAHSLLLVGEPGWGKTAFSAQLFRSNPDGSLLAAHFCRADRADTIAPRRFIENLIAMTALRIPAYDERVRQMTDRHDDLLYKGNPDEAMERLYLEPLAALEMADLGATPRYLLVDALDEATGTDRVTIPELLARTLDLFPEWLRLVATTRDLANITDLFSSAMVLRLDHADERNRRDISRFIEQQLPGKVLLSAAIAAKAQGNALVASQLALTARKSGIDETAIAALPRGLTSLYRMLLLRRYEPAGPAWASVREILEMVLATPAPLPIMLATSARDDAAQYATRTVLSGIEDLLQVHDDAIRLFHQTLAEFLASPATPFFINPAMGATRLADLWLDDARRTALPTAQQSFCDHYAAHWIAGSIDPGKYVPALPQFYDRLWVGPFRLYRTPEAEDLEQHLRLVDALAAAGKGDAVIAIVDLAFSRADARRGAPWTPPPHPQSRAYADALQASFWITEFAFSLIRRLACVLPAARPALREALDRAHPLMSAFRSLGDAARYFQISLSGYFEDEADWILLQESGIRQQDLT